MRYVEPREPDAHRPARVRVMGGPGCAEDADIEYALRAVLWLVGAGDDPRARAQWRGRLAYRSVSRRYMHVIRAQSLSARNAQC